MQEGPHIDIEFGVVVQDDISIRTRLGKRFTCWLKAPIGTRITSHVEVRDLAAAVLDYETSTRDRHAGIETYRVYRSR